MLEISNLTIKINERYLIKNLNIILNKNDKLAIIGEEGNGKSTLLKCILGICDYANVSGNINVKGKIGYLKQSLSDEDLKLKVYDYLFIDENDYYNKINNFYKYLNVINLNDDILNQKMSTLSGGEKVKVSILKLLLEENDILFLDEPTNDLDIETLTWLEDFINNTDKPIMYVSHDETLLSNTANMILHIEQIKKKQECKHTLLKIDYDTYVNDRLRMIDKQTSVARNEKREFDKKEEKLRRIMEKVEHSQSSISRKDPHGAKMLKKKMHSLKLQEKKLDETELTQVPDVEESINLYFEKVNIPTNKVILDFNLDELKVDNKILSKNIKLNIIGSPHICIIGKNGVGKSTLIKLIYNELKNRDDIKVGYMPQNYDDILEKYDNVLDFVCQSGKKEDITWARMLLGNIKFTKEEMTGKLKDLSNGSKAKLFLIKLELDKCDILILDEPTRNVSPLSNPVIRDVLKNYTGCIISIFHDRKFINEVVDTLYELTENGLIRR